MVCLRCRMVVKSELEKLGITCMSVEPGKAETSDHITSNQLKSLRTALDKAGLELMNDRKDILVERIKTVILDLINDPEYALKVNFSTFLSKKLNLDYTYLANAFSGLQGITIEQYIIANKIRRAKELICGNNMNLTEISWELRYSSVAHLSTQFKKITGVTPSQYKHGDCQQLPAE